MQSILPKLTRDYIFNFVSQEEIFSRFTGVSVMEILECAQTNLLINSPLRKDNNPTVGFYYKDDGRLQMNDFAGYFQGDCFDLVGYRHLLDADNSRDHAKILDIIAKEFSLHSYNKNYVIANPIEKTQRTKRERLFLEFKVTPRKWNTIDYGFWGKYHFNFKQLSYFDTTPVQVLRINNRIVYTYDSNDPAYAYLIGIWNEQEHWKIYFPYRQKSSIGSNPRFLTNSRKLDLLKFVKKASFGIISKARKCSMCLKHFKINSTALAGETILPTPKEIAYLSNHWDKIYSLTDFDYPGITLALKMKRTYNTTPLFITNGSRNSLDFQVKDFSDHLAEWGFTTTDNLVTYLKEEGTELTNDFIDFFKFNYKT